MTMVRVCVVAALAVCTSGLRGASVRQARLAPLGPTSTLVHDLTDENAVLRNEIVRKDAIIEGLLQTLTSSAMSTSLKTVKHATPLTDLCQISKEACDAVASRRQRERVRIVCAWNACISGAGHGPPKSTHHAY